jgi:hypothetical protein
MEAARKISVSEIPEVSQHSASCDQFHSSALKTSSTTHRERQIRLQFGQNALVASHARTQELLSQYLPVSSWTRVGSFLPHIHGKSFLSIKPVSQRHLEQTPPRKAEQHLMEGKRKACATRETLMHGSAEQVTWSPTQRLPWRGTGSLICQENPRALQFAQQSRYEALYAKQR